MMRFLNRSTTTLGNTALILGVASLGARLLGVLRDRVLAGTFGAGELLDVYYASFRIPDVLYDLVITGALMVALVPVVIEREQKHDEWRFISNVLNVIGVFLVLCAAALVFGATPIMRALTQGFTPEQQLLAISTARILALSPLLLGLSSILGSVLQVKHRMVAYSLSPILYNCGIIAGAIFFAPFWGVQGLAWGVILGAFLHVLLPLLTAFHIGFRWKPVFDLTDPSLRKTIFLGIPRILSSGASHINLLVMTFLAAGLAPGSLSVFHFANNIQSFPLGIIGVSLVTAVFPTLSRGALNGTRSEFIAHMLATFRTMVFYMVPAAVLLLVLRAQIVRMLLGTGNFDWNDTILTADTLAIFAVSLVVQGLVPLFNRAFYALQNSWIPFVSFCVSVVVNIGAAILLAPLWGIVGLAMAFSLAVVINFSILFIAFEVYRGRLLAVQELKFLALIGVLGVCVAFLVQAMKYIIAPFVNMHTGLGILTQGFVAGVAGLALYLVLALWWKVPEAISLYKTYKSYWSYVTHS